MRKPEQVNGWRSLVEDYWSPCDNPTEVSDVCADDQEGLENAVRERVPLTSLLSH